MRYFAIVITGALLAATPAAAQTQVPELHPYGLDPYKPSDAAILRNYGGTLLAQTPMLELRQLDPYKPSHADLLRQLGNGIPQWSHFNWYPNAPVPAPLMLPATPPPMSAASQPGVTPSNTLAPRPSPERPREALPVPQLPQPRAPGSVITGPRKVQLSPEEAARTLRGVASHSPTMKASVDTAPQDPPTEP